MAGGGEGRKRRGDEWESRLDMCAMACETAGGSGYAARSDMRVMACETAGGSGYAARLDMRAMACKTARVRWLHSTIKHACYGMRDGWGKRLRSTRS